MKSAPTPTTFTLKPLDNARLAILCGQFNANIKQIEGYFGVDITNRSNVFSVVGDTESVGGARTAIRRLYARAGDDLTIDPQHLHSMLTEIGSGSGDEVRGPVLRIRKTTIRGQNRRQQQYLQNILAHDISLGIGPAGTGKTYLAVACAASALSEDEVDRIVLVRPAVEAGERLGFLPGDIGQKVDPYLRPLYDALYEMFGFDQVGRLLDRSIIEIAPLAYMRGRTLNDAFVILDEAQNTTIEQMKMFLTRIGFGSRAVVTGDVTQIDLPRGCPSGLKHAINILGNIEGINMTFFKPEHVVRHPLVQRIVQAYETDNQRRADD